MGIPHGILLILVVLSFGGVRKSTSADGYSKGCARVPRPQCLCGFAAAFRGWDGIPCDRVETGV
ncbi:hypothetical protein AvCA_08010 [Azotobacter vinelandii CA]|uniref:Uncharacterized protein n=2 Tax=Azotobacter vinelandii TaxID=354 RepID=C1DML6_AZOVD|nr:hypothetical protein Avin_08010 [Azotobacter vinelandii DJ]AGK15510.1 hypothetical protein AvCA_08010 [Azotobacter vinelandii CA]AGK19524.1 hypothetical protein AvCA6_08010 [Azotobacter vinelandii CA6]